MKTIVLTVSRNFLAYHPKAGQPTSFIEKLRFESPEGPNKIHTIRANPEGWERRIKQILAGEACLSLRYWSGKPYKSVQGYIATLKESVGHQKITICNPITGLEAYVDGKQVDITSLARNDGLSREDFEAWFAPHFKKSNVFEGAIIHFTHFRY